jgi:uncharacterized protein (TIGR03435 family)
MNARKTAITLSCVIAAALAARGQNQNQPRFEVASIKRNTSSDPRLRRLAPQPGGRLVGVNAPVRLLIQNAYQLRPYQILGGPTWVESDGYDIDARAEAGTDVSPQEVLQMLQPLLADRFKLMAHRETRTLPIYVLEPAKNGLKLPPPKEGNCANQSCGNPGISITTQGTRIFGSQISMAAFARMLSVVLARPVTDKTGFTGVFDADVSFLADQATSGLPNPGPGFVQVPDPNAVTIFTALQEQLGLHLAPDRGPVDVLVIDSVERPSEN